MRAQFAIVALSAIYTCTAQASCIVEPLGPQLQAAEVVYIGTVVESTLVHDLDAIRAERLSEVRHRVVPQVTLKGDPASVPSVLSSTAYSDPALGHFRQFPERLQVEPGDTILVVGKSAEPTYIGLCTASRHWDGETRTNVRAVFPTAP